MPLTALVVQCPSCLRTYNIYPDPQDIEDLVRMEVYLMECDFCQTQELCKIIAVVASSGLGR